MKRKGLLSLKKYALWALTICLFGAVLFGCAQTSSNNSSKNNGAAVNGNRVDVQADDSIVLAEQASSNILVTGIEQKSIELIAPITVHIGAQSKTYQWENVSNPEYYPEVIVDDLDLDGTDELYVFLTKGYGTGVLNTEAHIMKMDFTEITAPNPTKDLKNKLSSTVVEKDGQQIYTITFNSKSYELAFSIDEAAMWFEEAAVGKITSFRLENKRLIASQSLQVSPSIFIGTIDSSYRLENGQFVLEESVYIKSEPEDEPNAEEKAVN